eukprot:RCo004328
MQRKKGPQLSPLLQQSHCSLNSTYAFTYAATTAIRSPALSMSPGTTAIFFTVPSIGEATTVSIFIADITASTVPFFTTLPTSTLTSMMDPGMGAPIEPGSDLLACSRTLMFFAAEDFMSRTNTLRGWPFSSKNTSRVPSVVFRSPMALKATFSILPFCTWICIFSPIFIPARKAQVGISVRSPNSCLKAMYSSITLGYMMYDITSQSLIDFRPYFCFKVAVTLAKSVGGRLSPGRPSRRMESIRPFSTLVRIGSGKPPSGCPSSPSKYSTTLLGKDSVSAFSSTAASLSLFCTMNCARSPTTLELGVTFTMSPSRRLAAE